MLNNLSELFNKFVIQLWTNYNHNIRDNQWIIAIDRVKSRKTRCTHMKKRENHSACRPWGKTERRTEWERFHHDTAELREQQQKQKQLNGKTFTVNNSNFEALTADSECITANEVYRSQEPADRLSLNLVDDWMCYGRWLKCNENNEWRRHRGTTSVSIGEKHRKITKSQLWPEWTTSAIQLQDWNQVYYYDQG